MELECARLEDVNFSGKNQEFCLDLGPRCLLDIQGALSGRQLDV